MGKLGPGVLNDIVSKLPLQYNENLLCGMQNNDDASVYKLGDNFIINTLDFFGPNVDDAYKFGQIAASNSMSDIFAMGGKVLFAQNILQVPEEMNSEIVADILKGALDQVNAAGGVIAGGHTTTNNEIVYGLSVTGTAEKIYKNDFAKVNDAIILTKKIGTGIYINEIEKDLDDVNEVIDSMVQTNQLASEIAMKYNISTMTDLTGFGLIGHLSEVALASNISMDIYMDELPLFPRTQELVRRNTNGGMYRNIDYFSKYVNFNNLEKEDINIIADPQTSGGLFIFVPSDEAEDLLKELINNGITAARIIGRTKDKEDEYINIL